jgi:hypothetical protein
MKWLVRLFRRKGSRIPMTRAERRALRKLQIDENDSAQILAALRELRRADRLHE